MLFLYECTCRICARPHLHDLMQQGVIFGFCDVVNLAEGIVLFDDWKRNWCQIKPNCRIWSGIICRQERGTILVLHYHALHVSRPLCDLCPCGCTAPTSPALRSPPSTPPRRPVLRICQVCRGVPPHCHPPNVLPDQQESCTASATRNFI